MSTVHLDQMDEHLLKQIVKKFNATSGTAFYCSCRGAKDFVDRVKPVWNIPRSSITHLNGTRSSYRLGIAGNDNFANIPLEFCRIEQYSCETDYINTVVLPEVAAVGGVRKLKIWEMSEGNAQLLIAAAKPETVYLRDMHNDTTSATFEGVKNLFIRVGRDNLESYWRTKKLFELARNRRSISLLLSDNPKQLLVSFIENWLKGEKTGTLERLTVIADLDLENVITLHKELDDLMKSHIKTEEGYIVERGGLDRLRMDFYTNKIDFFFS